MTISRPWNVSPHNRPFAQRHSYRYARKMNDLILHPSNSLAASYPPYQVSGPSPSKMGLDGP